MSLSHACSDQRRRRHSSLGPRRAAAHVSARRLEGGVARVARLSDTRHVHLPSRLIAPRLLDVFLSRRGAVAVRAAAEPGEKLFEHDGLLRSPQMAAAVSGDSFATPARHMAVRVYAANPWRAG